MVGGLHPAADRRGIVSDADAVRGEEHRTSVVPVAVGGLEALRAGGVLVLLEAAREQRGRHVIRAADFLLASKRVPEDDAGGAGSGRHRHVVEGERAGRQLLLCVPAARSASTSTVAGALTEPDSPTVGYRTKSGSDDRGDAPPPTDSAPPSGPVETTTSPAVQRWSRSRQSNEKLVGPRHVPVTVLWDTSAFTCPAPARNPPSSVAERCASDVQLTP